MSQMTATVRPLRAPAGRPHSRPQPLTVVPARPGTRGAWFVGTLLVLLVGGMLSLLLLNTSMARGSFELHALQARSAALSDQQEALQESIVANQAPARLARRATAMGMVPAQSSGYLRLSDGAVLGVAAPAVKDGRFKVVTAPDPTAAKAIAAAAARKAEKARVAKLQKCVAAATTEAGVRACTTKFQPPTKKSTTKKSTTTSSTTQPTAGAAKAGTSSTSSTSND